MPRGVHFKILISWQARVSEMKCRFRGAGGVGGGAAPPPAAHQIQRLESKQMEKQKQKEKGEQLPKQRSSKSKEQKYKNTKNRKAAKAEKQQKQQKQKSKRRRATKAKKQQKQKRSKSRIRKKSPHKHEKTIRKKTSLPFLCIAMSFLAWSRFGMLVGSSCRTSQCAALRAGMFSRTWQKNGRHNTLFGLV